MRFRTFVEIFDSPPVPIQWPQQPKWFQFWKDAPPPEQQPGSSRIKKTGKFSVPGESGQTPYEFHSHIDRVGNNRVLRKAVKSNRLPGFPNDWKVAEFSFLQVTQQGNTDKITNTGNAPLVFNTVMHGIRDVIAKHPVEVIVFEASGMDEGRRRLYARLINKFIGDLGYTPIPTPATPFTFLLARTEKVAEYPGMMGQSQIA